MQVSSLSQEDPLEKGNGYPLQYSCLENSMDVDFQSMEVRHNLVTKLLYIQLYICLYNIQSQNYIMNISLHLQNYWKYDFNNCIKLYHVNVSECIYSLSNHNSQKYLLNTYYVQGTSAKLWRDRAEDVVDMVGMELTISSC